MNLNYKFKQTTLTMFRQHSGN